MRIPILTVSLLVLLTACAGSNSGPAASGQSDARTQPGRCTVASKIDCDWATRYHYISPF